MKNSISVSDSDGRIGLADTEKSIPQVFCFRWTNYLKSVTNIFDELFQNESFVDVTLVCENGYSIKAHKIVLSVGSPYFLSLFSKNPCEHPVVILKDIELSLLKIAIEFMYKGEIHVEAKQIEPLLKIAELLKIRGLTNFSKATESRNSISLTDTDTSKINFRRQRLCKVKPYDKHSRPAKKKRINKLGSRDIEDKTFSIKKSFNDFKQEVRLLEKKLPTNNLRVRDDSNFSSYSKLLKNSSSRSSTLHSLSNTPLSLSSFSASPITYTIRGEKREERVSQMDDTNHNYFSTAIGTPSSTLSSDTSVSKINYNRKSVNSDFNLRRYSTTKKIRRTSDNQVNINNKKNTTDMENSFKKFEQHSPVSSLIKNSCSIVKNTLKVANNKNKDILSPLSPSQIPLLPSNTVNSVTCNVVHDVDNKITETKIKKERVNQMLNVDVLNELVYPTEKNSSNVVSDISPTSELHNNFAGSPSICYKSALNQSYSFKEKLILSSEENKNEVNSFNITDVPFKGFEQDASISSSTKILTQIMECNLTVVKNENQKVSRSGSSQSCTLHLFPKSSLAKSNKLVNSENIPSFSLQNQNVSRSCFSKLSPLVIIPRVELLT